MNSIDERMALKKKLKCKNFKWFLDNIYPELTVPEVTLHGSIRQDYLCFDTLGKNSSEGVVGLYPCHDGGGNQEWTYTASGHIRHFDMCLTLLRFSKGSLVVLKACDEDSKNQLWNLKSNGLIQHSKLNVCLDSINTQEVGLRVEHCNSALRSQKWQFISHDE